LLPIKKRRVDYRRRTSRIVRNMRGRTWHWAINKMGDALTKKIWWLHLYTLIEIICVCKFQRNNLLSVRQSNYSWSWCPHNIKRNNRNMRGRIIVMLWKWRRLLLEKAPPTAACEWQVNWAATLVWWREKSAATVESVWERERGFLMVEGFDTKLRRSRRLNLLISQPFPIYMCWTIYNSKSRDYNTRVVLPIIFPIYIHFIISLMSCWEVFVFLYGRRLFGTLITHENK
jgi:hypothetical protein